MKRSLTAPLLALAVAAWGPASAPANCGAAADRQPAAPGASLDAARSATLCLLNTERASQHRNRLRFNRKLALAGRRHAGDMVRNDYFSHDAPSGKDFVQRIEDTHYVPPGAVASLGENLAWGEAWRSTPREIVRGWMASPPHRENILTADFREIGIAIVPGAPIAGSHQGATYASEFGAVHRG